MNFACVLNMIKHEELLTIKYVHHDIIPSITINSHLLTIKKPRLGQVSGRRVARMASAAFPQNLRLTRCTQCSQCLSLWSILHVINNMLLMGISWDLMGISWEYHANACVYG